MPPLVNPVNALFLVGVGLTIAFLVIGEILEARRARRPIPVRVARRQPERSPSSAAALKRRSLD